MRAAILSVGTEILFGQIINTNTVYLSKKLNELGIDVMYHHTVGDNEGRLRDIIESTLTDCDLIITTGGLGPTQDDMTKETVCEVMRDRLIMHEDILQFIKNRIAEYKKEMTDNNRKQALLPSRCEVFYNDAGTAPGFALSRENPEFPDRKQWIACLPGPPGEMSRMFEKSVLPWLEGLTESSLYYREVMVFGMGESDLETALLPLINGQTDPTIATYAKDGICSVRVASKRKTREEAEEAVDRMVDLVMEIAGSCVYSCDGEEYAEVVADLLMKKGLTISSAESCTGGMFAASLTDIPGISACFDRGLVTYSNQAKIDELGVKRETLEEYGAVSAETAREMAVGVKRVSGSDIGISVTGVAGPGGGTPDKPVGLVYIGFAYKNIVKCREINRAVTDRARNRKHSLLSMFDMIYKNI